MICPRCSSPVEGNLCPNCGLNIAQNAPPPPPPPAPKRSLPIIAVAVVIVIVVAIIAGALLLGGSGGGAKSPEGAFRNFVDAYNNQDIDRLIACDVGRFLDAELQDELKDSMDEEFSDEDFKIKIESVEQISESDMDQNDIDDIEEQIAEIEDELDIEIEDWSVLDYTITITYDSEDDEETGDDWLVVKIDAKWYNTFFMTVGFESSSSASTIAGALNVDVQSSTGAKITFTSFTESPEPTDIMITITNGDSVVVTNLLFEGELESSTTDMRSTAPSVTAVYTDLNYMANLINPGDYITIDGLVPDTEYRITIWHYPSESNITLVGATIFHTP